MELPVHIFTSTPAKELNRILEYLPLDKHFIVMPRDCHMDLLKVLPGVEADLLIDDSEAAKNLNNLEYILKAMMQAGLTRNSLLIAIGGGVTTDIAGLAAALYMRGIRYVNIPTTLLAMVDASSGGKTAVDFCGVKNLIGAFHSPITTIISQEFLRTLPHEQMLSGYAEMLKHELLMGPGPQMLEVVNYESVASMLRSSVEFKRNITQADPMESGRRRILNLGHTAGHAFESLAMSRGKQVTHGHAVAQGLIVALVLSTMLYGMPSWKVSRIVADIRGKYTPIPYDCKDYPQLLALMIHDKKNSGMGSKVSPVFSFVLLEDLGKPIERTEVRKADIEEALDITRDFLGL